LQIAITVFLCVATQHTKWLALGKPLFGSSPSEKEKSFPQLPGSQKEVKQLGELVQKHLVNAEWTRLSGPGATANDLVAQIEDKSHIHLTTHGFSEIPEGMKPEIQAQRQLLSGAQASSYVGLAFAKTQQAPLASRLNAEEIQSLDLASARLVVLSGCETGLGVWDHVDGMALWRVPDGPSSELMNRFYLNMLEHKMPKGEALRQAQIWMLRHRKKGSAGNDNVITRDSVERKVASDPNVSAASPFLWGGYVLSGHYR